VDHYRAQKKGGKVSIPFAIIGETREGIGGGHAVFYLVEDIRKKNVAGDSAGGGRRTEASVEGNLTTQKSSDNDGGQEGRRRCRNTSFPTEREKPGVKRNVQEPITKGKFTAEMPSPTKQEGGCSAHPAL